MFLQSQIRMVTIKFNTSLVFYEGFINTIVLKFYYYLLWHSVNNQMLWCRFFYFYIDKSVLCYTGGKSRALNCDTLDFLVLGSLRTSQWDFFTASSCNSLLVSCTVFILYPDSEWWCVCVCVCVLLRAHRIHGFNSTYYDWPNICVSSAHCPPVVQDDQAASLWVCMLLSRRVLWFGMWRWRYGSNKRWFFFCSPLLSDQWAGLLVRMRGVFSENLNVASDRRGNAADIRIHERLWTMTRKLCFPLSVSDLRNTRRSGVYD